MWLKILRQNISQFARRAKGSASIEHKNGNGNNKGNKTNNNGAEVNRNEEQNGSLDKSQAKKKPVVPGGGPLLQQTEISTSQLDFFRMLDEKIESGPDYDETADTPLHAEHVTGLLRRWELASATWSSTNMVSDVNATTSLKTNAYHQQHQPHRSLIAASQQSARVNFKPLPPPISGLGSTNVTTMGLSAKDRESMRNIIGGRPESAPVFVQRGNTTVDRLDGLGPQYQHHCPSPNMPRHVLESISQSPTQSLKTPPGISSPTTISRYQHYHHPDFQQQSAKVTKAQYSQGPSPLNGEFTPQPSLYRDREYITRQSSLQQQQSYDSPGPNALIRNSPSNPYVQQFQITSAPQPASHQQQYAPRKRTTGGYGPAAQMT